MYLDNLLLLLLLLLLLCSSRWFVVPKVYRSEHKEKGGKIIKTDVGELSCISQYVGYNYIRFLIITCCQTIDELFVENSGNINYDRLIKLYLQY